MNRLKLLPFFGALAIACPAKPCRVARRMCPRGNRTAISETKLAP